MTNPTARTEPSDLILPGHAYLALPRNPETWLLRSLLPVGGLLNIYGEAKIGKSFAALQMATALQHGGCWLGFQVVSTGPVVYIQLDTPRSLWLERLDALGACMTPLHYADRDTLGTWPFDIGRPDHFQRLQRALQPVAPVAVFLDTLREAHAKDENKSDQMQTVFALLQAATYPAALIVISHARKPTDAAPDLIADQRGSSYTAGRVDAVVRFTRKTLFYTGRAIEEGSIRLTRLDNGFWEPDTEQAQLMDHHARTVLVDPTLTTVKAQALALSTLTHKSPEACRSFLRRR